MKFIVPPQKEETQDATLMKPITLCWKCSENPRACGSPL
jgi:hypothetical protein